MKADIHQPEHESYVWGDELGSSRLVLGPKPTNAFGDTRLKLWICQDVNHHDTVGKSATWVNDRLVPSGGRVTLCLAQRQEFC